MTTETTTTIDPGTSTPEAVRLDGENKILATRLAEVHTRLTAVTAQVTTLTTERDSFKTKVDELTPKAAQADDLGLKVTALTNERREAVFIEKLRTELPGADPIALRGVVALLHKDGKVNQFPEDAVAEMAKALPIIKTEAPSLTRPPTTGGGSLSAPLTHAALGRRSLVG